MAKRAAKGQAKKGRSVKSPSPAKASVPAALVKQAAKRVAAKRARLLAEARQLVSLVKRRKAVIAESFYELGGALRRLKDKEMLGVLGVRTFEQLCETKLALSAPFADQLIKVVETMTLDEAIEIG